MFLCINTFSYDTQTSQSRHRQILFDQKYGCPLFFVFNQMLLLATKALQDYSHAIISFTNITTLIIDKVVNVAGKSLLSEFQEYMLP